MTLTPEQLHILETDRELRFLQNGVEFVVLRSDELAKVRENSNLDHEELRSLLARSSAANGWDEPGMEAYDSYGNRS